MKISDQQFARLFPALAAGRRAKYLPLLVAAMEERAITTRKRAVAFLAQLGHESCDLKFLKEIWGNTPAQQRYDVRADLGNTPERDGDGKKYQGRGGIQRTGRKNYLRAEQALGLPLLTQPELLEEPENAFRSDALFWFDNRLNKLADRLTLTGDAKDLKNFDKITRIINGGYNGRVDRQRRYLDAIEILHDEDFAPPTGPLPGEQPAPPPAPQSPDETLEKLKKKDGLRTTAKRAARSVGLRIARPFLLLYGALEAGNVYAWLGVIVAVAVIIFLLVRERQTIRDAARWAWKKIGECL